MVYISNYLQKDLVVYEMNVRAFTADESSGLDSDIRGTYLGLIEKVLILFWISFQLVTFVHFIYYVTKNAVLEFYIS